MSVGTDKIYKVCSGEVYDASLAAGHFLGMPVDHKDGYLHFSTAAQLRDTLRLYFAGETDLALFSVQSAPLGDNLKWEPSRGGDLFPHLFAELPMTAIVDYQRIDVAADGTVDLPGWVS